MWIVLNAFFVFNFSDPTQIFPKYEILILWHHIFFFNRTRETKRQLQHKDAAMEVVDDVCESEGVCEVMCDVLSDQPERGESMETHVSRDDEAARMAESASAEEHAGLSAAAHSAGNTGTEPQKPRYSYRLVFKEVCCKPLDVFRLFLAQYCCTQRGHVVPFIRCF